MEKKEGKFERFPTWIEYFGLTNCPACTNCKWDELKKRVCQFTFLTEKDEISFKQLNCINETLAINNQTECLKCREKVVQAICLQTNQKENNLYFLCLFTVVIQKDNKSLLFQLFTIILIR